MSAARMFFRAVAAGYAVKVSAALLGLALTPLLLSHLGRRDFGVYVLLTSLMPWLAVADVGFVPALRIHLARELGRARSFGGHSIAAAWYGQWLVVAGVLLAGFVGAGALASFFGVEDARAVLMIRLLTAAFVLSKVGQIFSAVLSAHQRVDLEQIGRAVQAWVRAALIVVTLLLGGGLAGVGLAWVAAALVALGWLALRARLLLPDRAFAIRNLDSRRFRPLLGTGLWLSLGAGAGLLIVGADRAIVARIVSLEAVTSFSITASLYVLAETLLNHFVDSGRPLLSRRRGEGDIEGSTRLYLALRRTTRGLGWIAALAVLSVNHSFITIWVGAEHYGGFLLDAFFALNLAVQSALIPERAALASALMVRPATLCRVGEGVLNVALSVVLAGVFGLAGIAVATALAAAMTSSWYLPRLASRVYPGASNGKASPLPLLATLAGAVAFRLLGGGRDRGGDDMVALSTLEHRNPTPILLFRRAGMSLPLGPSIALVIAYGPEYRAFVLSGLAERLSEHGRVLIFSRRGLSAGRAVNSPVVRAFPFDAAGGDSVRGQRWLRQNVVAPAVWRGVLGRENVAHLVSATFSGPHVAPILKAAHGLGVRVHTILNSWKDSYQNAQLNPMLDSLGVFDSGTARDLITSTRTADSERIFACGSLHVDAMRRAHPLSRSEFCYRSGLDPLRPFWCYSALAPGVDPSEVDSIRELARRVERIPSAPQLLIRVNPRDSAQRFDLIPGVGVQRPLWDVDLAADWNLPLGEDSVTLEFAAEGKPVVNLNFLRDGLTQQQRRAYGRIFGRYTTAVATPAEAATYLCSRIRAAALPALPAAFSDSAVERVLEHIQFGHPADPPAAIAAPAAS